MTERARTGKSGTKSLRRLSGAKAASPLLVDMSSPTTSHDGFPYDPDFPQLPFATDPEFMFQVFRRHLKPIARKVYDIQDCQPFRFRCRQSQPRCVLQYTLRIEDAINGQSQALWVTGLLYAEKGLAERLWHETRASEPRWEIPKGSRTFESVSFVPELQMLVEVFPFDRRLPNLCGVLNGEAKVLEPWLLSRLQRGRWRPEHRAIELMRYRTELGAVLRYSIQARDTFSSRRETLRCYLKLYRDDRGAELWQLLQRLSERREGPQLYSVNKPVAYASELRMLALEEAPGIPLSQLLLDEGSTAEAVRSAARAAAAFNQDELPILRHESRQDHWEHLRLAANLAQWACPRERKAVEAITTAVLHDLTDVPPAPIHGDLKPDHVFVAGDRVVFIDLDSAVQGDPVRDPAHMFAYLASAAGLGTISSARAKAIAWAFADEYFRSVPTSWRERFPTHCAGALLEVAGGIFRRQDAGWPQKVTAVIEMAQAALSGRSW